MKSRHKNLLGLSGRKELPRISFRNLKSGDSLGRMRSAGKLAVSAASSELLLIIDYRQLPRQRTALRQGRREMRFSLAFILANGRLSCGPC